MNQLKLSRLVHYFLAVILKNDGNKKWSFKDNKDVITISTKGIIEEGKTILYVTHDEDDGIDL